MKIQLWAWQNSLSKGDLQTPRVLHEAAFGGHHKAPFMMPHEAPSWEAPFGCFISLISGTSLSSFWRLLKLYLGASKGPFGKFHKAPFGGTSCSSL